MTLQAPEAPNTTSDVTHVPNDFGSIVTTFSSSQMIILGGRPAMGKTSVALDFARHASVLGNKTTLFFSLEMKSQEVLRRISFTPDNLEKNIDDARLVIDDSPVLNLLSLRTKCLNQKASAEGLDLVIIDYLQLMDIPTLSGVNSRDVVMSTISHGIKLLAEELGCPIVILSQLSRDLENRINKTPRISDLRESSSLEQDADTILFAHRPECDDPTDSPGQIHLIIAKNRGGATGTM